MSVQKGKVILRTALNEDLIMDLKIAALQTKVNPNVIVDAALRLYLSDQANLEILKSDLKLGIKNINLVEHERSRTGSCTLSHSNHKDSLKLA